MDYLKTLVQDMHTVILATVDDMGNPITCAIDMMDADEDGLYFLSAKGKNLYQRLIHHNRISLTALKGKDTLHSVALSIQATATEIGNERIPELSEKNRYMYEIYPTEQSRMALTVFRLHDGQGEWFDLSCSPIQRASFVFGKTELKKTEFVIQDTCNGCGTCLSVCPQQCINATTITFTIHSQHCLHCGNCMQVCPMHAITKKRISNMGQYERRQWLIQYLLQENTEYRSLSVPKDKTSQNNLLRALMNVRMPVPVSRQFLTIQDAWLKEETAQKGIVDCLQLPQIQPGIILYKGDITTLVCDGIINAANAQMLGCFCANHGCIDNAIHTYAGVQLRAYCNNIMEQKGRPAQTGEVIVTPAFNLPSHYILHTVGPIIYGSLTQSDCDLLHTCYENCLMEAEKHHMHSIAFCCISTGEFHFPNEIAAQIAVDTVRSFLSSHNTNMTVIFNVFKEEDHAIYRRLLTQM